MARALLVALWCATATTAAAARYGDYSGARMPQYGGPDYDARDSPARAHEPDEYRGHSPDAPAALDYKYEEELAAAIAGKSDQSPVKENKKDVEEIDSWQRPARKYKKKKSNRLEEELPPEPHDRFNPEDDFPKTKSRSRYVIKHRPRLKSRKFEKEEESERHPINHRENHDDIDINENEESGATEDYQIDKRYSLDDKRKRNRGERVARRKPRDKFERETGRDSERDSERELAGKLDIGSEKEPGRRSESGSDREDIEKVESEVDRWMQMRGGLGRAPGPVANPYSDVEGLRDRQRRPENPMSKPLKSDDDERIRARIRAEKGQGKIAKNYEDYNNDYYDMKRVLNIKNKLPSLLRRTSVREELTAPARLSTPTRAPVSIPGPSRALESLLSNRRLFLPPPPATRTTLATPTIATEAIPISTTATKSSETTTHTKESNKTELSLAEKSRLSIMKKAMRKENMEGRASTTKPPVLLQVTMKMPTVVMVEPPSSEPFLRAREVFADSPKRLDQVKRLMRHKLVANAKNIHDLTDNWDDLVCDYIDMSLLDRVSNASCVNRHSAIVFVTALVIWVPWSDIFH